MSWETKTTSSLEWLLRRGVQESHLEGFCPGGAAEPSERARPSLDHVHKHCSPREG